MAQNSCESCTYYTYDEDYESYMCDINMDEDEYILYLEDQEKSSKVPENYSISECHDSLVKFRI